MLTNELAPVTAITGAYIPQYLGNNCHNQLQLDYTPSRVLAMMAHDAGVMPIRTYSGFTFNRCPICGRDGHFTVNGGRWICECSKPTFGDNLDYMVMTGRAASRRDALAFGVM